MKRYISNRADVYLRITNENDSYYICDTILIPKTDIIEDLHVLDELPKNKYYIHVTPFYN